MRFSNRNTKNHNRNSIILGLLVSIVFTLLGAAITGVIFHIFQIEPESSTISAIIIYIIAVFMGSLSTTGRTKGQSIYTTLFVGLIYWGLGFLLLSLRGQEFSFTYSSLTLKLAITLVASFSAYRVGSRILYHRTSMFGNNYHGSWRIERHLS